MNEKDKSEIEKQVQNGPKYPDRAAEEAAVRNMQSRMLLVYAGPDRMTGMAYAGPVPVPQAPVNDTSLTMAVYMGPLMPDTLMSRNDEITAQLAYAGPRPVNSIPIGNLPKTSTFYDPDAEPVICTGCGAELRTRSKFCPECGMPLKRPEA